MKARLLLDNGMIFEGENFGAEGTAFGEICFNTSMTGYQEILTDPSYAKQVIVMTYPEIGNYGINKDDFESSRVSAAGFVVKNYSENESHYKSYIKLKDYLKQQNIIGISNIDTRRLTTIIRESGAMNCVITTEEITGEVKEKLKNFSIDKNITKLVSRSTEEVVKPAQEKTNGLRIAVIDCGIKKSIIDCFKDRGCELMIFPNDVSADKILESKFDAVLISNGPGDPQDAAETIKTAKELTGKIPIYGICLGYQILCIALGGKTYKLKYGHRGGNHPVINKQTGKVFMTSQNHGYAVDPASLPENVAITYVNLNDETLEGFSCKALKIDAVQFHPEAAPGPYDAQVIFDGWVNEMLERKYNVLDRLKKLFIKRG